MVRWVEKWRDRETCARKCGSYGLAWSTVCDSSAFDENYDVVQLEVNVGSWLMQCHYAGEKVSHVDRKSRSSGSSMHL